MLGAPATRAQNADRPLARRSRAVGKTTAGGIFVLFVCALSLLPVIVVYGAAFTNGHFFTFPPQGLSFKWLDAAIHNAQFTSALVNDVIVSALATILSCALGLLAAYGVIRGRGPRVLAPLVEVTLISPLLVPGIIVGFGATLVLPHLGLISSLPSLVVMLAVITLPYSIRSLTASLAGIPDSIEEAAQTLGASRSRTVLSVIVPMMIPGFVSAAVFAFVLAFDNVTVSLWLTGPSFNVIPIWLFSYVQASSSALPAAAGAIAATINLVGLGIFSLFGGLRQLVGGSVIS